jgi:uncharacterized membrane protein YbhN (UPF0104 family)
VCRKYGMPERTVKLMTRKQFLTSVKIVLTLVLIVLILHRVGARKFVAAFETLDVSLFLVAVPFFPLVIAVGTEKWRQMLQHEVKDLRYNEALISFLGGMSLGLLTPGRVGEIGRILFINHAGKGALAGIAIVDKIVDLEVTLALAVAGAYVFWGTGASLAVGSAVLAGLTVIFLPELYAAVLRPHLHRLPFQDKIAGVLSGMTGIPTRTLVVCLLLRLLASLIDIFQFFLLIRAFAPVGFMDVVVVYPLIILTNILPLTIGGIGVREGVSMLTLARFGIASEAAVNASFLLFCINTLLPGLLGSLFIPRIQLQAGREAMERS